MFVSEVFFCLLVGRVLIVVVSKIETYVFVRRLKQARSSALKRCIKNEIDFEEIGIHLA